MARDRRSSGGSQGVLLTETSKLTGAESSSEAAAPSHLSASGPWYVFARSLEYRGSSACKLFVKLRLGSV
jgi:hypothetical protein